MTLEQYRRQWARYHRIYERRSYFILRRAFIKSISDIDLSTANESNYDTILKNGFTQQAIQDAYVELYTTIGLQHGRRVLRDIERESKSLFSDTFERDVIRFIVEFGGRRITTVSNTFLDFILHEIAISSFEGTSISQVVTNILKRRNLYRWQLLRIARTETTAAAGYASDTASSTTGLVLEKLWVSARDPRTRITPEDEFDHFNLNGMRVDDGEPFEVDRKSGGTEFLRFPGDPMGSAGNTINCRCSVVKIPKRDSNGNIIRRF